MADARDGDHPLSDADAQQEAPSEMDQSSSSDADVPMVVARTRRANAGNRMSKLLQLAEAEDTQNQEDYGEIFQEAADDVEFQAEDEEDINLVSSTDEDEDDGADDDEQGEKELKRAERTGASKKRKRESLLQNAMKRATARMPPPVAAPLPSPTTSTTPTAESAATRPRKKSERVSWLPVDEEGPQRQSSRGLSVQNKQAVHERLKVKEKHRLRTVAIMKAAEARKEASRPKILTQAERLEEAAATERMNSKSLNRWETNEKKRVAEQAARLAALKNRKLEGPIISHWSGPSVWESNKLRGVGKAALKDAGTAPPTSPDQTRGENTTPISEPTQTPAVQPPELTGTTTDHPPLATFTPSRAPTSIRDELLFYANQDVEPAPTRPPLAPTRPNRETAARTLIELRDFEDLKPKDKDAYLHHLLGWPATPPKRLLPAKKQLCVVTGQPAQYCDPATGLPYSSIVALKGVRRLVRNEVRWSSLLGLYNGRDFSDARGAGGGARPAVGVPAGFRTLNTTRPAVG